MFTGIPVSMFDSESNLYDKTAFHIGTLFMCLYA